MDLHSFTQAEMGKVHGKDCALVRDRDGRQGLFDVKTKSLVVPCEFASVHATQYENLWHVADHGGLAARRKGVIGLFDSNSQSLVIPTVCQEIYVIAREWVVITVGTYRHFRWTKHGLYSLARKVLYIDTSYEEDHIPRWNEMTIAPTPIPAAYSSAPSVVLHEDDVIIIDMYKTPVIFSRKLGEIVYPVSKK